MIKQIDQLIIQIINLALTQHRFISDSLHENFKGLDYIKFVQPVGNTDEFSHELEKGSFICKWLKKADFNWILKYESSDE